MCTHTYRDVMTLPSVKKYVYMALDPQCSEEKRVRKEMELVEAKLNVMQVVFLVIQTSPSLGTDILEKGREILLILISRHFTDTLEVPILGDMANCTCPGSSAW